MTKGAIRPRYLHPANAADLPQRAARAMKALEACRLCPRACGVNRLKGEIGLCGAGAEARVASYGPHFGEERPLVGRNGSGTIFFSHCNLRCNFCQNYEISHLGQGRHATAQQLAAIMLALQDMGCHNINLVTPSHLVPQILAALVLAAVKGLSLPLVYNSGGYDSPATLALLDGAVDIYMPDFKFWDARIAEQTCQAPDYRQRACAAIAEMHRQVGDLVVGDEGLAYQGLLLRHLVLPGDAAGTSRVMGWVARQVSRATYVNVMGQYRPCGQAGDVPSLGRRPRSDEIHAAVAAARAAGLERLDGWH